MADTSTQTPGKLLTFLTSFIAWLRSVYSESDGNGSSTRLHIAAIFAFTLGCGISFAWLVHKKTITIEEFDAFLVSATAFITGTAGPLYGVNKLADWAKSNKQNGPQQ
jgi:hypothetical protein